MVPPASSVPQEFVKEITPRDVDRTGIEKITEGDIRDAASRGNVIKLICHGAFADEAPAAGQPGEACSQDGQPGEGCNQDGQPAEGLKLSPRRRVIATVRPVEVPRDQLLANIDGTSSVVSITTDLMGKLSIVEHNPEILQTGYGIFSDLMRLIRHLS